MSDDEAKVYSSKEKMPETYGSIMTWTKMKFNGSYTYIRCLMYYSDSLGRWFVSVNIDNTYGYDVLNFDYWQRIGNPPKIESKPVNSMVEVLE